MPTTPSSANDPRRLPTLVDTLRARAAATPEDTLYRFLVDGENQVEALNYEQLDQRARAIAAEVQRCSAPGDRVLLLFAPGLDYIAAFFGCLYAGRIAVPAYPPELRRPDRGLTRLRAIAADCQPTVFLTTSAALPAARTLAEDRAGATAVHCISTDDIPLERDQDWRPPDLTAESLAFLQYTSGSTATPRGVRLTHGNLRANLAAIFDRFGHVTGESRGALWLPPYHDMGLIGAILEPAWGGFTSTLLTPMAFLRRPARWLEVISRDRCDIAGGPNFAFDHCVRRVTPEEKSTLDLSCWRIAFNGAEPVRAETLDRFAEAFASCGFSRSAFYPCYGLAEATLLVSGPPKAGAPIFDVVDPDAIRRGLRQPAADASSRRLVKCGTAALGELLIADPASHERLADGKIGEIWLRGEHVAAGYWRQTSENDATFGARLHPSGEGPFLRTGDLGYLHDGYLVVTGRLKDLIIVGGRNHYPHDIESTVENCHPALRAGSCVAFSIEDGKEESLVVMAEVRGAGSTDSTRAGLAREVAERVRAAVSQEHQLRVARFYVAASGTIPKTSSGKLQRSACRAALLDGTLDCLWVDDPGSAGAAADTPVTGATAEILAEFAARLRVAPEALDPTKPLIAYGLDSLALMELQVLLKERYRVDVPFDVLLSRTTIVSLIQLVESSQSAPSARSAATSPPARFAASLELSSSSRAPWLPTKSGTTPAVEVRPAPAAPAAADGVSFSLFFFGSDAPRHRDDHAYQLLLDCVRFADENGFEAVWTPERHFHKFGGQFPNPAVLGAALAGMTRRIKIRAGSVVVPLSSPVRIAEDWAVVDNISRGRVGVSFATGWNPNDFVIRPEAYADRRDSFGPAIQVVRRLWKGEPVALPNGEGRVTEVRALPLPYQRDVPVWVTAVKNRATFELAGSIGANLLTNLLLYRVEDLATHIAHYRRARAAAGFDPDTGRVTLMLHTFVGETNAQVRTLVEQPLRRYIEASVELWSGGVAELGQVDPAQRRRLIDSALDRHFASGLFGSHDHCFRYVEQLRKAGVNEIACLVDFGLDAEAVLPAIRQLNALRHAVATTPAEDTAPPPEPTAWPLTFAQERMWFLQELEPRSPVYNDLLALRSEGALDEARLLRALQAIVHRHEVLRTVFPAVEGTPVQRVLKAEPLQVQRVDLGAVSSAGRDEALRALACDRAQRPFDLATTPPLRATLVRLSNREHVLMLVIHHIATDAASARNLWRELAAHYRHSAGGNGGAPSTSALQQREVAGGERERRDAYAESLRWWKQCLSPHLPPLELYADRSRPQLRSGRGIRWPIRLDARLTGALRTLAAEELATPFMVLLSIYAVVLQRYSGQPRFGIGTPFEGRDQPGTADAIGSFVNTLALPMDLSGSPSFRTLLRGVRAMALEAYAHARVPFGLVVEALEPERLLGRTPIFQVMFSLQRAVPAMVEHEGLRWQPLELGPGTAKFDLRLDLTDGGDSFHGYVEADADLFAEGTVTRIASHFRNAAAALVSAPDMSIGNAELGDAEERAAIEAAVSGEIRAYDLERTLDGLVFEQSARTPDAVALEWSGGTMTFGELARRADALASQLATRGARRGDVIALLAYRSPELMIGLLATMRAGAAFLPLDPSQPRDRIAFMLGDAAPRLILAQPGAMEHVAHGSPQVVPLLFDPEAPAAGEAVTLERSPHDIAYLLYTSGSTGRPKGVLVRHRSAVNRLLWSQQDLPLLATDIILQKTAITFDVFVWEAFAPLMAGARLVLADRDVERDPGALLGAIRRHCVTVMHFVPSMLHALLDHRDVEGVGLRRVHCSGEVLPVELQNRFFARWPEAGLVNLYGPTEAAVDVTWWTCRPEPEARSVPIGPPAANVRLHVLDDRRRPVWAGLPGDLYISGVQVAAGYLNRPDAEAAAFVDDPAAGRLYRTGDVARLRPDWALEYLGRGDGQVKVRGYRIELGEVEAVLHEHAGVRDAVVVLRDLARGEKGLVAYVVFREEELSPRELRTFLATRLPEQMIPAVYVAMEELPRTTSGKVDRRGLPEPPEQSGNGSSGFETDTAVREVTSLFREVLGLTHVGSDQDFFELGGHSLLAAQLIARIRAVFGVNLVLRTLFVDPTPRGVATSIQKSLAGEAVIDAAQLAIDREGLVREARLEPTFEVRARERSEGDGAPTDILLTGTTGFVGAFLLRELIANTNARIHCLVRASSAAHGLERIRSNLILNGVWDEAKMPGRIRVIVGDLGRERLGLDRQAYDELAQRMDLVFHNAALVDHARLYRALRAPNVSGTKELLRLSTQGRVRAFHYISTLSVFEAPAYQEIARVDESDEPHDPLCYDSYAQSKWVAERLVHQAGQRGMPVTIHRLAMCTGDSQSGRGGASGLFAGFLSGIIRHGVAPELQLDTWLTPVDFVAKGICHLSLQHRGAKSGIFHLGCPEPVPYEWIIEALNRRGHPVSRAPFEEWRAGAIEQTPPDSPLYPLLPFVTDNLQGFYGRGRRPHLGSQATASALARAGIVCPRLSEDILGGYIDYWREIGLLGRDENVQPHR